MNQVYLGSAVVLGCVLFFWLIGMIGSNHRTNTMLVKDPVVTRPGNREGTYMTWGQPKVDGLITNVRYGLHD